MSYWLIALIFLFVSNCEGFFSNDLSTINIRTTINGLNLTCSYYDNVIINCEYCVYQFYSNSSASTVWYNCIQIANTYKSISQRCEGFSDTIDIGYGVCSPLPFELFTISILCICATDMCNQNLTACQSSVKNQSQSNTAPSALPLIIPPLDTPISCKDREDPTATSLNISYYCQYYASPYMDVTKCNEYVANNTVLCMYIAVNGEPSPVALTKDNYISILSGIIYGINLVSQDSTFQQFYNETSSYFYVNWNRTIDNMSWIFDRCVCAEDNCNSDLTSCLMSNKSILISLVNGARR